MAWIFIQLRCQFSFAARICLFICCCLLQLVDSLIECARSSHLPVEFWWPLLAISLWFTFKIVSNSGAKGKRIIDDFAGLSASYCHFLEYSTFFWPNINEIRCPERDRNSWGWEKEGGGDRGMVGVLGWVLLFIRIVQLRCSSASSFSDL